MSRFIPNADQSGRIGPGRDLKAGSPGAGEMLIDSVINLDGLPDVDIVLTSDQSKWSECIVVETAPAQELGSGAWPRAARWATGYDQPSGTPPDITNQGLSRFPGYAINVNTGQRLNIFFGESSWDKQNNGDDLLWNPTGSYGNSGTQAGGRHYIYVTDQPYDGCASLLPILRHGTDAVAGGINSSFSFVNPPINPEDNMDNAYQHVAWVGIPMVVQSSYEFADPATDIPTDVKDLN